MDCEHIDRIYNPQTRCVATYRDPDGYPKRGLMLEPTQKSVTGEYFVYVDSYHNRIPVGEIIHVEDTHHGWSDRSNHAR